MIFARISKKLYKLWNFFGPDKISPLVWLIEQIMTRPTLFTQRNLLPSIHFGPVNQPDTTSDDDELSSQPNVNHTKSFFFHALLWNGMVLSRVLSRNFIFSFYSYALSSFGMSEVHFKSRKNDSCGWEAIVQFLDITIHSEEEFFAYQYNASAWFVMQKIWTFVLYVSFNF